MGLRLTQYAMIAAVSLLASARGAEVTPPNLVPRDSLVTVNYAAGGSAFVIGLVNGKFVPVQTHECPGAVVFTGPPGSYLVIAIEGSQRFQHVTEIVDGEPVPPPPTPDPPGPNPPPPTPVPDTVERKLAIGPVAYTAAMQTGAAAADIQRLASAYRQASVHLHELRLTPESAQRQLRDVRDKISGNWTEWERQVEATLGEALAKHGSGQLVWRDCCREIASALEAAAARKTGVRK